NADGDSAGVTQALPLPTPTSLARPAAMPSPDWMARFVDDIPTGVAVFDRDLCYVAANSGWIKAFQLTGQSFVGRHHHELDCGSGAPFAELQRRALFGEVVSGCNRAERDAAGHLSHRAIGVRPWLGPDGTVLGVVAALHEIVTAAPDQADHD